jgi:hypothetical protein
MRCGLHESKQAVGLFAKNMALERETPASRKMERFPAGALVGLLSAEPLGPLSKQVGELLHAEITVTKACSYSHQKGIEVLLRD